MDNIISKCEEAQITVNSYYNAALDQVRKLVIVDGTISKENLVKEQHASHGLAWIATYRATLKELINWSIKLESNKDFQEMEKLILQFAFSEFCSQIKTGIPMSQLEYIRPQDMGLKNDLFNCIFMESFLPCGCRLLQETALRGFAVTALSGLAVTDSSVRQWFLAGRP